MTKQLYPDFFNDVFGPIMQPGSSGGFAGPTRLGNAAASVIDGNPMKIRFLFHRKHVVVEHLSNFMSDRAYLGGVQGFATDDVRLFDAHALARQAGISYDFGYREAEDKHHRGVRIEVEDAQGNAGSLEGTSVGGGMIFVHAVNDFPLAWRGDTFGVLVIAEQGQPAPTDTIALDEFGEALVNVAQIQSKTQQNALFIELSQQPDREKIQHLFSQCKVIILPALLPVITKKKRRSQLFQTVEEWRQVADDQGISFVQAAIAYEKAFSGWTEEEIWNRFALIADVLDKQIHALENIGYDNALDTPNLPIYGKHWNRYEKSGAPISDSLTQHILIHAFSTNAKLPGVCIVPGPMGTGGGYLFSALDAVREARNISKTKLLESLAVAAALGALAYTHTNASGEVGCVGESGVCCAMAAGAVTWLVGGDGVQVERAASMALQASIGIPCDPIPGGLEFPCITRTIRAAVTAPLYADLALAGIDPLIPYHELLQLIEKNFQTSNPDSLCGSSCGCNLTPTACIRMGTLSENTAPTLHYSHGA